MSLLCVQITRNSAMNGKLAHVLNNRNNCSECFSKLIKSSVFLHGQLKLLILLNDY